MVVHSMQECFEDLKGSVLIKMRAVESGGDFFFEIEAVLLQK